MLRLPRRPGLHRARTHAEDLEVHGGIHAGAANHLGLGLLQDLQRGAKGISCGQQAPAHGRPRLPRPVRPRCRRLPLRRRTCGTQPPSVVDSLGGR